MEDKEELYGKYLLKGAKLLLVLGCIILFVLFIYDDDKPVKMNLSIIEERGDNLLCEGVVYYKEKENYLLEVKKDMSYYKVILKGTTGSEMDLDEYMKPIDLNSFYWNQNNELIVEGINFGEGLYNVSEIKKVEFDNIDIYYLDQKYQSRLVGDTSYYDYETIDCRNSHDYIIYDKEHRRVEKYFETIRQKNDEFGLKTSSRIYSFELKNNEIKQIGYTVIKHEGLFENENDFWKFIKYKKIKGIPKDFEIDTSKTKYLSKDKIALVGVEESKNVGWNDRQYVIYTFDFKTNKLENINLRSPYKVAKNKRYPYIEVFEDNSKDSISFIWGDYEKARELIGDSYSLQKFVKNGEFVKLDASGRIFLKSKEQQEMLAEMIASHNWGILIGSDESIYIGGSDSNIDGNYIFKLGNKWNRLEYINIIEKKKN